MLSALDAGQIISAGPAEPSALAAPESTTGTTDSSSLSTAPPLVSADEQAAGAGVDGSASDSGSAAATTGGSSPDASFSPPDFSAADAPLGWTADTTAADGGTVATTSLPEGFLDDVEFIPDGWQDVQVTDPTDYAGELDGITSGDGDSAFLWLDGEGQQTLLTGESSGPLSAPANVVATAETNNRVRLTWIDNSTDESGFSIQRSSDRTNWSQIATVSAGASSYADYGRLGNTSYWYRLSAFDGAGQSGPYSSVGGVHTPTTGPAAPSNLAGTAISSTQIDLTWKDISFVEWGYTLERSTSGAAASWNLVAALSPNTTSYSDTDVQPGQTYYYRANCYYDYYGTIYSSATVTTPAGPPAPMNLSVTASSDQWQLAWSDNSSNESGFSIQRSTDGGGSWSELATVGAGSSSYLQGSGSASDAYRVRAYTSGGDSSAYSNSASAQSRPAVPSNVIATSETNARVRLTWIDNSTDETAFLIERSTDQVNWGQWASVAANATTYFSTTHAANSSYWYRLRAVNALEQSSLYSSLAATHTTTAAPGQPLNLQATAEPLANQINLTWTDNSFVETGYLLERSSSGAVATWNLVAEIPGNATAYADTGLAPGATYYYRLKCYGDAYAPATFLLLGATSGNGNGSITVARGSQAPADPPAMVADLWAEAAGSGQAALTWRNDSLEQTALVIERSSDGGQSFSAVATLAADATSYSDDSLTPDSTRFYRVVAAYPSGYCAYSPMLGVRTLAAPSGLSLTPVSSTRIDLSWEAPASVESGFVIDRKGPADSDYAPIASVAANVTTYSDNGLAAATSYAYRVRSVRDGGASSQPSGSQEAATFATGAPSHLVAEPLSTSSIRLTWQDNGFGGHFAIQMSTNGAEFSHLASVPSNGIEQTWTVSTGLSEGEACFFRVGAYSGTTESDWSNTVRCIAQPAAPTDVTAQVANESEINVSWSDASHAEDSFLIEMSADQQFSTVLLSGTAAANACHYAFVGLTPPQDATSYYFRVAAVQEGVQSAWSAEPGSAQLSGVSQELWQPVAGPVTPDIYSGDPAYFLYQASFEAGTYRIRWGKGALNFCRYTNNTQWGVRIGVKAAGGLENGVSGPGVDWLHSQPEAEAAAAAANLSLRFQHAGGWIGAYLPDSPYDDNAPGSPNPSFVLERLMSSDSSAPRVSVTATRVAGTEGAVEPDDQVQFTISTSGYAPPPPVYDPHRLYPMWMSQWQNEGLPIYFTLSGTAAPPSVYYGDPPEADYTGPFDSGTQWISGGYRSVYRVILLPGQFTQTLTFRISDDEQWEPDESVVLSLYADDLYRIVSPFCATATIHSDETVDLDIDSDNDDGFGDPDRDPEEDQIEDDPAKPGKIIAVNDDDSDADGIPDFADGFGLGEFVTLPEGVDPEDFFAVAGEQFVPVKLQLPAGLDLSTASFQLLYDASAPAAVAVSAELPAIYDPAPGHLRLWTSNGSTPRSANSLFVTAEPSDTIGYYVPPSGTDLWYGFEELTKLGFSDTNRTITLWVEATDYSTDLADQLIEFRLDPDGSCSSGEVMDAVRLTAFKTTLFAIGEDGSLSPVEEAELSHPTPRFSGVSVVVSNLRPNADSTRILGDVAIAGEFDDAASDLIAGSAGTISGLTLALNGDLLATVPTTFEKSSGAESLLAPYDFSATFEASFSGVELQPGVNLFHLAARNAYGLSGFAEQSVEVLVQAPPPQPYEYEVRVTQDPYADSSLGVSIELRTRIAGGAWQSWRVLSRQDQNTFAEADPVFGARVDLVLDEPLNGPELADSVWATISDRAATENKGEAIDLIFDRIEQLAGVQRTIWKGEWTREDHDLDDLSRHTLGLGQVSPLTLSDGGEFHPILMGIMGPPKLVDVFDQVSIGDWDYQLTPHEGQIALAAAGEDRPNVFLVTANYSSLIAPLETPIDEPTTGSSPVPEEGGIVDFGLGVGAGLLQTIPDTLVGLWDGAKFLAKQAWNYTPVHCIYRLATTGDMRTVEDQRRWQTAKGVALTIAQVVWKIHQDRDALIHALQTGDEQTVQTLSEEYRIAFEFAAEMLDALWDGLASRSDYEKGKIVGRIVGEVVLTVVTSLLTGGGAAAAKGATMAKVARRLKDVEFLRPFIGKFDDLIALYTRIDGMVDSVEHGAAEGRAIAQRIASIIAHHQYKTGKGTWEAFEQFLSVTNDARRRAVVDSHLAFATNMAMRESYKEAAEVLRNGGTLTQAMAKVPTHQRIGQVMAGRREAAFLESHHTATKFWAQKLGVPVDKLDDMPALVLDKAWHRQFNDSGLDREWVFHNILRDEMKGVDPSNKADVVLALRKTYRKFYGILDDAAPDPDVWVVVRAWLTQQGVP